jgi:hypothetical protein
MVGTSLLSGTDHLFVETKTRSAVTSSSTTTRKMFTAMGLHYLRTAWGNDLS